jgi:hypothetical protein
VLWLSANIAIMNDDAYLESVVQNAKDFTLFKNFLNDALFVLMTPLSFYAKIPKSWRSKMPISSKI